MWTQEQQLLAADGAPLDSFGNSVSVSGDTVLAGARSDDVDGKLDQGSAYAFLRSGTVWTQQEQLFAYSGGPNGEAFGKFGGPLGRYAGGRSAPGDNSKGAVYVFRRIANVWTLEAKVLSTDLEDNDYFGNQIALSGDTLVVGAHLESISPFEYQGAAYVFNRVSGVWTQTRSSCPQSAPRRTALETQ